MVKKRCFIIGNGPSLNHCDLSLFDNEITIGMNRIHLRYSPTYVCCSDFDHFKTMGREILKADSRFVLTRKLAKVFCHYKAYNPARTRVVDLEAPSRFSKSWSGKSILDTKKFDPEFKTTYWGATVLIDLALPLAAFLKMDEVYLVGVDWTDGNHFYPRDQEEFTAWKKLSVGQQRKYRAKETNKLDRKIPFLKKADSLFPGNIYNCTVGGKLELFPRRCLEDVLKCSS